MLNVLGSREDFLRDVVTTVCLYVVGMPWTKAAFTIIVIAGRITGMQSTNNDVGKISRE